MIMMCGECQEEVVNKSWGDEGWTVCTGCGITEGPVVEVDDD